MNHLYFVSTLPRSGSALLLNLLGQNPEHHVTPTNDLIEMVMSLRNNWMNFESFKAQGLDKVKPRVMKAIKGMMRGFYQAEFDLGHVVFDKSRGWLAYIELLEEILERKVKMLVTVRDVRAIIASFEKIHRKTAMTKHTTPRAAFFESQTIMGRARQILTPGAVVGLSINRLRDALDRGLGDRLMRIPYHKLTTDPIKTLEGVHKFLGLPAFTYDPGNVKQITQEDDTVYGMPLHSVRQVVASVEQVPWAGILPDNVASFIAREYADINAMASA